MNIPSRKWKYPSIEKAMATNSISHEIKIKGCNRTLTLVLIITLNKLFTVTSIATKSLPNLPSHKAFLLCVSAKERLQANKYIKRKSRSFTILNMTESTKKKQKTENALSSLGFSNPLILGSGSFTRKLILKEMGIPFHLMVRSIDERNIGDRRPGSDASKLVLTLAKAKANHLVQGIMQMNYEQKDNNDKNKNTDDEESLDTLTLPKSTMNEENEEGWIVLTADQVVTYKESILEKPLCENEAHQFVKGYATAPPKTVGACVLTHIPTMTQVSGVDTATIHFLPTVANCVSQKKDDYHDHEKFVEEMELVKALLNEGAPIMSCAGGLMVEHPLVKTHIDKIDGTEDSVMGLSKDLVIKLLEELKLKLDSKV